MTDCNVTGCMYGGICNKNTGQCESGGLQPIPYKLNCNFTGCMYGGKCNKSTGECESGGVPDLGLCDNQKNFNHAFYTALNNAREEDAKKISIPLVIYLVMHTIFLIWGIILAFKSQPPQNRIVHITLAIVFAPAYVLGYYLNAFE